MIEHLDSHAAAGELDFLIGCISYVLSANVLPSQMFAPSTSRYGTKARSTKLPPTTTVRFVLAVIITRKYKVIFHRVGPGVRHNMEICRGYSHTCAVRHTQEMRR